LTDHGSIKIERILCPVDFSEFSIGAYRYASSLAQQYGARLFVQHVVEFWRYPYASFVATADVYSQFCQRLLTEGEEELRNFLKSHDQNGIYPECVIRVGMAADCILSLADEQTTSLIVMGTHGRRGFDRLMLGSVTEKFCETLTARCWRYVRRRATSLRRQLRRMLSNCGGSSFAPIFRIIQTGL